MSDEEIPDPLASLDQALAAQRAITSLVRAHFVGLLESGFTEPQAMSLTATFAGALADKTL